jgi:leucyl aminopeptidase
LPIDIQLTAIPASADTPLAAYLGGDADEDSEDGEDIAVAVQGADVAGLEPYLGGPAADVLAACQAGDDAGDVAAAVVRVDDKARRLLFLGLGDGSEAAMRTAGAALARRMAPGQRMLTSAARGQPATAVRAFAEGLLLGSYRFSLASHTDADGAPGKPPAAVRMLVTAEGDGPVAVAAARTVAEAVALARDLANMPPAEKTPAWLADQAVQVAASSGLTARVWEPAELAAEGFGGVLAVGSGSARPPRLIELAYQPAQWTEHVVLVGKGITFDSGGLSLKPNEGMKMMKTDMAGGAAIIAAMSALAKLGAGVRVTGLVAAAENMPSGSAMRPGDVITHYGGRTTEVLNTDAEGRLVLADALAYADALLRPDVMVDLATLTGAARVALGGVIGALYATEDGLAGALLAAGGQSGEPLWRMPLVDDYVSALESPVADSANVPHAAGQHAGSIEAALFLREFTGNRPWAHLDIAGAARSPADEGDRPKGATGFGTRLLLRWLTGPQRRLSRLHGREQPVAHRHQQRDQSLVLPDQVTDLPDGQRFRVVLGRVGDPAAPQRVVEGHDATDPEQAQRGRQVGGVLMLVGVAEHQVVGAVGEAGQHVAGLAADEPVPVGREPGLGERLARKALVLGVNIDAGQHAVLAHPAEQPDAGGPTARADLDHRPGGQRRRDEPQGRARRGADRRRSAHAGGIAPGVQQR